MYSDIIQQIFYTIFPLTAVVLTGFFYAKKYRPDMSGANQLNIDIFCPALIFSVVSAKSFNIAEYQTLVLAAIVVVLGSGLLIFPLCRLFGVNPKTVVPPAMFSNTGNMGLPLMVLAFGEAALPAAVVLFIVENTLHFTVGVYFLNHKSNPLKVLKVPMISVTLVALCFSVFQWRLPVPVETFISMLGQISIPLMLFALGVRMTTIDFSDWKVGLLGAVLTPFSGLIVILSVAPFWQFSETEFKYLLLFSVLPPAVLNYMVAEKYNQQPQQVASIVLMGNIASIVVVPLTLFYIFNL